MFEEILRRMVEHEVEMDLGRYVSNYERDGIVEYRMTVMFENLAEKLIKGED